MGSPNPVSNSNMLPPAMPSPMPQFILASGQLVQGIQGAQLLIPTSQGLSRAVMFIEYSWYSYKSVYILLVHTYKKRRSAKIKFKYDFSIWILFVDIMIGISKAFFHSIFFIHRNRDADHPNDTSKPCELQRPNGESRLKQWASGIDVPR